jgi:hypothetical protein
LNGASFTRKPAAIVGEFISGLVGGIIALDCKGFKKYLARKTIPLKNPNTTINDDTAIETDNLFIN